MAGQQGQCHDRGFREAVLGKCQVQTCIDRFGDGATEVIRQRERDHLNGIENDTLVQGVPSDQIVTGVENEEAGSSQQTILERKIPKTPYFRNNLTALSQRYNLYFAAYENRIFVYRPKGVPKQALPQEPGLILATKPDKIARHIGGTLNVRFHHQINHVAIGFLGREEILVSVYDDGSVFAYYIRQIAGYIERIASGCRNPNPVPTYFFRENVGISAWGIAIHQKSRLIAISSNKREVTVFAFGLSRLPEDMESQARPLDYCERSVLKRKRNWRICIPLGDGGHNIPNLSLWDDPQGFAEKVVANDIYGTTWILDIWKVGTAPFKISHRANIQGQWAFRNPMGWGVIVLPYESFLPARSVTDLLGMDESDIMNAKNSHAGRWIETQRGLSRIRDHPAEPIAQRMPEPETFGHQHHGAVWFQHQQPAFLAAVLNNQPFLGLPGPPLPPLPPPPPPPPAPDDDNNTAEGGGAPPANVITPPGAPAVQNAVLFIPDHEDDDDGWSEEEEIPEIPVAAWDDMPSSAFDSEDDDNQNLNGPDGEDANEFVFIEEALSAAEEDHGTGEGMTQILPPDGTLSFFKNTSNHDLSGFQSSWLDMVYTPHDGKTYVSPTSVIGRLQYLRRPLLKNRNTKEQDRGVLEELGSRCCILRTYEEDIEMRSINPDDGAAVFCKDPITWMYPPHPLLQHSERLNMILHISELSLVVIGSAMGRVILLTPTRSRYHIRGDGYKLKQGFRIDRVLPTLPDEKAGRRPPRGLYGIAAGPIQEGGATGCLLRADDAPMPSPASRRYRLMLHYRDHSILSYEISRDDKNEHILIF
ncbi:hypothetical protein CORC01_06894 [Colletotrichum orchidophilum]|uniref:Uncharacterized protein n=1 Tax=Colletotrichum orchidophilum TaxID=1209926 RepID=A0A1G4B8V9_9PEZI|nr:uncharacterized protein CORC01_06894 [Colletotrichum orchidophilum]OHE97859.1 hypothetical protein CORC01_06894 [Colletotrichum orchidophilum]